VEIPGARKTSAPCGAFQVRPPTPKVDRGPLAGEVGRRLGGITFGVGPSGSSRTRTSCVIVVLHVGYEDNFGRTLGGPVRDEIITGGYEPCPSCVIGAGGTFVVWD